MLNTRSRETKNMGLEADYLAQISSLNSDDMDYYEETVEINSDRSLFL